MRKKPCFLGLSFVFVLSLGVLLPPAFAKTKEEFFAQTDEDKVDKIRQEVESIVAQNEDLTEEELQVKRAYCGNLVALEDGEITIDADGNERKAALDEETTIIDITREEITPDELETGSFIIAMGYLHRGQGEPLQVKRLVVQETPPEMTRQSYFGQVKDLSSEESVIVLSIPNGDGVQEVLAEEADIFVKQDGEKMEAGFSDVAKGDRLVLVAEPVAEEENRLQASTIYVLTSPSPTVEE